MTFAHSASRGSATRFNPRAASGHLVDLGTQILGSGPASTLAVVGDTAGLIACAISARYGLRHLSRSKTC